MKSINKMSGEELIAALQDIERKENALRQREINLRKIYRAIKIMLVIVILSFLIYLGTTKNLSLILLSLRIVIRAIPILMVCWVALYIIYGIIKFIIDIIFDRL